MKKTLFRKALSIALAMSMTLSLVSGALAAPLLTAAPSKYAAQIQTAQAKGLMVGYGDGSFGENDPTNRAMFVTILENMCGGIADVKDKAPGFTDVKAADWFADGVAWAVEKDIVDGYPDNTFRGTQTITREELAVMAYKYAQNQSLGGENWQTVSLSKYSDGAQVSDWAQTAYRWCLANGILQPNESSALVSGGEVTRGETAAAVVALAGIDKKIHVSGSGSASKEEDRAVDFDSYTETLPIDWSQAAQLPLTGWFTKAIGEDRSVKVYIPEEASIRSYFTVVAVPEGVDTYRFLKSEGWLALADEKGEGLFVLEPGKAGWGSVEEETAYVNAAVAFLKGGKNDSKVNVFSTYGEFYLVGYEGGAAPLEAWAAENPIFVISQVYLDGESAGQDCLAQRSAAEYDGKTSGYGTLENLDESLNTVGLGGRITRADVPVPTWLVDYAADSDSLTHWLAANDCLDAAVDGVYWQDINSKAYQTEYANRRILAQNADAQHGIAQVKVTAGEADAQEIYAFLSQYTRYDNSFAYSNMLTWRLDYTAARVEAQKQAAKGQTLATLQGKAGSVDILGQSDVEIPGHGTVQVGVFAFSDNNGDGKNDPREYLLFLPEGFEGKELPVAMVFPGNTQTDSIFMDCTPWWEIAEEEGVALVMVCETYSAATAVTHIDSDKYYHATIALLDQQIDGVYADLDLTRVYGAGQSRGSRTVQNFARSNPEFFAAVGSTSGVGDVNDKALPPAQGVGELIPASQVCGQNDMAYLEPDLWGSDSLVEWGRYLLHVNGAQGDLNTWTELEQSGRYSTYTWDNAQGIPVFQWIECQVRAHNCYPDDVWANWEYVKHFRLTEDGTRYYSASAFEQDDAVVILSDSAKDIDAITQLDINWSQAAQHPVSGWFNKNVSEGRTAKLYLSETAPLRAYFIAVAVPDGVDTKAFLTREGWFDLADEKSAAILALEPGAEGWGTAAEEADYVNAAMKFLNSGRNAKRVSVFTTFGTHYLVGYGEGAAPLEQWAVANPVYVNGQVYLNGESLPQDTLTELGSVEYGKGSGTMDDLQASIDKVGIKGVDIKAEVPVPTWFVNYDPSSASVAHWMSANDCLTEAVDGVYYQDVHSTAYQSHFANQRILAEDPEAKHGISQVKLSQGHPDAETIYEFVNDYSRYTTNFTYSNALVYRMDYFPAMTAAHADAADGQVTHILSDGTQVLASADVALPGLGTAQVAIFNCNDLNGDGQKDPRECIIFIPEGFEGQELPVVFAFPGNLQTDVVVMDSTCWWQIAKEKGFVVVAACGTYSSTAGVSNADSYCYQESMDTYVKEMIDGVYADLDHSRFYGAGHSQGSRTVQGFAATHPEYFAAVGTTSGLWEDGTTGTGVGGMIPIFMINGEGDMAYLEPGLFGGNKLLESWANYMMHVNGVNGDLESGYTHEWMAGRTDVYRWVNDQGISLFQWGDTCLRAHNAYPSDFRLVWDFLEHFRFQTAEDGTITRYYSPSAFEADDVVVIEQPDYSYQQNVEQPTRCGTLKGFEQEGTLHWFGVPYAQAPVGELRWKELRPLQPWKGVLDATESQFASQMSGKNLVGSEAGAVTLDITRPNTDETGLPIFFYIHGGNNQTGKSSAFPATQFVQETNCVVVSVNHRLGLLGFNALPALKNGTPEENSGNFALLDLATALDWVKENAESFGGDGSNITITGSSAGGRDVMAMVISPIFEGKFQKAISYSGGMTVADVADSQRVEARALAPLVVAKGLKATAEEAAAWLLTDGEDVRTFLYSLTDQELASAFGGAGIRMSAFPHLFNDGVVLPVEGFDTTNYIDVPMMMVTGSSEFSTFCKGSDPFGKLSDDALLADEAMLAQYRFAENYGSMMYGYFNAEESAERMFPHYQAPIYTCDVDWGENADVVGEKMAEIYGSYHCMTTPLMTHVLYTASLKFPEVFAQKGCLAVSAMLNQYYSNFLWTGNPNGEGLTQWDPWTSLNGTTQLLVDGDKETAWATMSTEHTSYEEIIALMEKDNTITEEQKALLIQTVMNGRWFSTAMDKHYNNEDLWK